MEAAYTETHRDVRMHEIAPSKPLLNAFCCIFFIRIKVFSSHGEKEHISFASVIGDGQKQQPRVKLKGFVSSLDGKMTLTCS